MTLAAPRLSGVRRGGTVRTRLLRWLPWLFVLALATLASAFVATGANSLLRMLYAVLLLGFFLVLMLTQPRLAAPAVLTFLPFLGLVRRLLIADAGWPGQDPLILVSSVVAAALVIRLLVVESRPLAPDIASRCVVGLIALGVLQVANPAGAGIAAGVAGLLFVTVPLLYFVIGRELATERIVLYLCWLTVGLGVLLGTYALYQSQVGYPSWDKDWFEVLGGRYEALNVGNASRPFASFSSAAESALYGGAAFTLAAALVMIKRNLYALLALPFLAVVLFLSSSRGALVSAGLGIFIMAAMRLRRAGMGRTPIAISIAVVLGLLVAAGPLIQRAAGGSSNDLVSHQVSGVTNPLNSQDSTAGLHADAFVRGIREGITRPLGVGPGAAGGAAGKLGGAEAGAPSQNSEVDLGEAFRLFGVIGGFLYLGLMISVGVAVVRAYAKGHDLALPIAGLLAATLGQWLTGGHYALSPLTWFLVGWVVSVGLGSGDLEDPSEASRSEPAHATA